MTDDSEPSPSTETRAEDGSGSFATYLEYNRVLRTWFVAFGIGGPALFLVNDDIARRLSEAQELRWVVLLFLTGAAAQVIGAFINKVANWYVYLSRADENANSKWLYEVADWLIEQFWIDVILDVLTIAVFGIAAWEVLTVFAGNA